jgi:tetratricopeptide (TPR) repeat protein
LAESPSDSRIRDLKRRLELDPTSRLFVSLAEEYRKAGRFADALITLQLGLKNHPSYVSAQVALGRAFLETGNVSEAIATFQKVLNSDPGNLVSAKSLADIYLSRGESVEAIKKYKLYRALSGDRTVDEIIGRLEKEIAPPAPPRPSRASGPAPLPAPPTFFDAPTATPSPRSSRVLEVPAPSPPGLTRRGEDILEVTSIKWEDSTSGRRARGAAEAPKEIAPLPAVEQPARPMRLEGGPAQSPPPPEEAAPPPSPAAVAAAPFAVEAGPPERAEAEGGPFAGEAARGPLAGEAAPFLESLPETAPAQAPPSERTTDRLPPPEAPAEAGEPQGRALADLYFAQGHYTEALRIYDDLASSNPFDAELKRLRRDAEARLLPATGTPSSAADPALQRRLGKIRALKEWLSVVQAG